MSDQDILRRGDEALEWVWRASEAPRVGATLVVQGHEQAVFVARGVPLGAVGPGRYLLDPAQWPAVAPYVDASGQTLQLDLYFVTTGGAWFLDLDAPVGAVSGLGAGRAGYFKVGGRVGLRVSDALAVVRAVVQGGGDFAARYATWVRDAGRLLADTAHGMLVQGTLDPARMGGALFTVGRNVLPALRGRLSAEGVDVLELESFTLVEAAAAPQTMPSLLRIEASVLAEALAAAPDAARPLLASSLTPVLVVAPARVGVLRAGVVTPSTDHVGVRHDQGVPLVAMDARMFPRWRGAEPVDLWVLRQQAVAGLGVEPWPVAAGTLSGEDSARDAYDRCRRHLVGLVRGLDVKDTRATNEGLMVPDTAWSECFLRDGKEVAWLSVDRGTEALSLAGRVGLAAEFSLPDGVRGAAWRPGDEALQCAVVTSTMGEPDGVAVVTGLPAGQTFAAELPGRWEHATEGVALTVDVPSGWLVLSWARVSGRAVADRVAAHGESGWMPSCVSGDAAFGAVPTGLEAQAGGPVAWVLRERPGTWRVTHHHGASGDARAQCLVLQHVSATPWRPAQSLHAPAPRDEAATAVAVDREVFPGVAVPRVSDYVRMVRGLRGDAARRRETLAALGIDLGGFGEVMQRWTRAMMADHDLGREVARAMNAV